MIFAGIAWDGRGFEVALLDEQGAPVAPAVRFPAGQVAALTDHLRTLDRSGGQPLVCVIESTNGMLDGGLMSAGLRVHRADPWVLPPRPAFGSVDAASLARTAAQRLAELPRLAIESGTLTGRGDEHGRWLRDSEAGTAALTRSGRCFERREGADDDDKVIALTFDDGPNPPHTGRILDVLDRYGVPATFFCVGLHASAHTEEIARMSEAGHRLANHTWSHPFLPDLTVAELSAQMERTDEAIARVAGEQGPRLFRPPYGSRTPEILSWLGETDAGRMVLWDVDANDWALPGADAIAGSVLARSRPGSIVLMHDGGGDRSQTADALPAVIEGLLGRGYRFARVDEMTGPAAAQ